MTPTPARRPVRTLDLIVGILIAVIGAMIGTIMLGTLAQLGGLATGCEGCDTGYLGAMLTLGNALVVFGWFVTTGIFIVRVVRRKLAFWAPIIGIIVIFAAFYIVAFSLRDYGS